MTDHDMNTIDGQFWRADAPTRGLRGTVTIDDNKISAVVHGEMTERRSTRHGSVGEGFRLIRGSDPDVALSGLRRGEISGLRWSDVDLDRRILRIRNSRVSAGGAVSEGAPKTKRSQRDLPLTDDLVAVLRNALIRQQAERAALGADYRSGAYVLSNEIGHPYHPDTVSDLWIAITRTAGVRPIRLHDARHTCGTLMHLQNVPIAVISAWLGHSDSSFTMRTYMHSQDPALRAAADSLGSVVTLRDIGDAVAPERAPDGRTFMQVRGSQALPHLDLNQKPFD